MKKLLICLLFAINLMIYGQGVQPLRVELSLDEVDKYNVLPVGKEGVIIFYDTEKKEKGCHVWKFIKYNTDFKEVSKVTFNISNDFEEFISYSYNEKDKNVIVLFSNKKSNEYYNLCYDIVSNKVEGFELKKNEKLKGSYSLDLIGGNRQFGLFTGYNDRPNMVPLFMAGCAGTVLLFGAGIPVMIYALLKAKNYSPSIYFNNSDFEKKQNNMQLVIPKVKGEKSFFLNSDTMSNNKVAIAYKTLKKKKTSDKIVFFDYNAKKITKTLNFDSKSSNSFITMDFVEINPSTSVVIGSYSNYSDKNGKVKAKKINQTLDPMLGGGSQGIYFSILANEKPKFTKYYEFSKFKSLYQSFNKREQKIVDRKKARAEKKNKELSFNFKILLHDVKLQNDKYIAVAEVYYPEYHREFYTDANGKTTSRLVFDGFRYTHAMIICFDKEGNLVWEQTFEIEEILTYNLKKRVKSLIDSDGSVVLIYNYGGAITSKVIKDGKVVSEKEKTKITTNFKNDKIKQSMSSDSEFWYDNYFLAFGYEKIKNKDKGKRKVFYFNKIAFE